MESTLTRSHVGIYNIYRNTHMYHSLYNTHTHTILYIHIKSICICIFEGSLEVKLPTIWTDEKQSREEAERSERLEERRVEEKEYKKKEDADA